jgi:DNA-directed RNA polymerase specialized sigma24 family protein
MFDRAAESSRRVIEELAKPGVRARLVQFARWRMHADKDAEDLVHEALARVCDPDGSPWDPAKRSFLTHMGSVMNGIAVNELRSARARKEVLSGEIARDETTTDGAPQADDLLAEHRDLDRLRRWGGVLRARLQEKKDTIALEVYDCGCEGIEDKGEIADRIGRTLPEVRDAMRRLTYLGAQVRAEEEAIEERIMKEARNRDRASRSGTEKGTERP